MIFTELTVHNFGPFCGEHVLRLAPPSKSKPVVLLGGMNGAGKTTLLDALNLALYGKRANCSKRQERAYGDFLAASVNRNASPHEGAGVQLKFTRWEAGHQVEYCVRRRWSGTASVVRDQVEVLRAGEVDSVLTENWNDQVEEFIPSGIADLFLFDGEKVEKLADFSNSRAVLQSALHSLLGLGLVEQLEDDLVALERRKKVQARPSEDQAKIHQHEQRLEQLRNERTRVFERKAAALVDLEQAQKLLTQVEQRLRSEGGQLFDRRSEIESELERATSRVDWLAEGLRELAAGPLPLLLVLGHLEELERPTGASSAVLPELVKLLEQRDREILRRASERGFTRPWVEKFRKLLQEDRAERDLAKDDRKSEGHSPESDTQIRSLVRDVLPELHEKAQQDLESFVEARRHAENLERYRAAVPHEDAIAGLLAERDAVLRQVTRAEALLKSFEEQGADLNREIARVESWLTTAYETQAVILNDQEDSLRVVRSAQSTRDVLKQFRERLIARHTDRLSTLVLESFRQLLRKEQLIESLRIDPATLAVELMGPGGEVISPERLSAGERQLLAVSLLWALAKASGRPLPTVIDTPMGRLDSTHRDRLVERYFPRASHQVLLLSTDQEIVGGYLDKLNQFIGRSYQLVYDEHRRQTTIREGYFW